MLAALTDAGARGPGVPEQAPDPIPDLVAHAPAAPTALEHAAPATPAPRPIPRISPKGALGGHQDRAGLLLLLALAAFGRTSAGARTGASGGGIPGHGGRPAFLSWRLHHAPSCRESSHGLCLDDLGPVLCWGLAGSGSSMGFRTDCPVFEEVTAGIKQLVLARAIAAGVLIVGSTVGLLYFLAMSPLAR